MDDHLYHYRSIVTGVYDGDTITVDIDLGLNLWVRSRKVRLYGIDTPEIRGEERPEGLKVRDWLRERILNKTIILKTYRDKSGKYGRLLGSVWLDGENLNEVMVELGLAKVATF